MLKRLLVIGCILLTFYVRYAWREHDRNEALLNQYAPAFNSLSPEHLSDSDWSYSGPLGELTLHFEPGGRLTVTSDPAKPTGHWEINDHMLSAHIPGADQAHQAVFGQSTDKLSGPSPPGMQPPMWSASRLHPSE